MLSGMHSTGRAQPPNQVGDNTLEGKCVQEQLCASEPVIVTYVLMMKSSGCLPEASLAPSDRDIVGVSAVVWSAVDQRHDRGNRRSRTHTCLLRPLRYHNKKHRKIRFSETAARVQFVSDLHHGVGLLFTLLKQELDKSRTM